MNLNDKTYKVVAIPSNYSIVINVGASNGAEIGDVFEVFIPGKPLLDPDTKEELGVLDYVKAKICITQLYNKMCVCESTEMSGGIYEALIAMATTSAIMGRRRPLDVDGDAIGNNVPDGSDTIKIGDLVRFSYRPVRDAAIEQKKEENPREIEG